MKRVYEAPIIEKVSFVSDEKVCGLFDDLFGVNVASGELDFTKDSIFEWSEFEQGGSN